MKKMPAWTKEGWRAEYLKDWFPRRHEDEVMIAAAKTPKERLDAVYEAIYNRGLAWTQAFDHETESQRAGEELGSDIGGITVSRKDKESLAGELARFISKYGKELFDSGSEKHGFNENYMRAEWDDKRKKHEFYPAHFDYDRFVSIEGANPQVISEVVKSPEIFGMLRLGKYGYKDPIETKESERIWDVDRYRGLSRPGLAAVKALGDLNSEAVISNGFSKDVLASFKKYVKMKVPPHNFPKGDRDKIEELRQENRSKGLLNDRDLGDIAAKIDSNEVPKGMEDEYLSSLVHLWSGEPAITGISKPRMIQKMMMLKHTKDSSDTVDVFVNKNPHVTAKDWTDFQKEAAKLPRAEGIGGGERRMYPHIPDRFLDDKESLEHIVNNWDWNDWNFNDYSGGKDRGLFFKLRDLSPEVMKAAAEKARAAPATEKDYKGIPHILNKDIVEFSDKFDNQGNYIKQPIQDHQQVDSLMYLASKDPNHEKVRDVVKHVISDGYMNHGHDGRHLLSIVEWGKSRSFMKKMSPEISQGIYGMAKQVDQNRSKEDNLMFGNINVKKIFANMFLSHPEFRDLPAASKFWNDYEGEVKAAHFPIAQAAMKGEHVVHRPFRKRGYEKGMLNENGEEIFRSEGSEGIWPALKGHARLSQAAVLQRYINDKNSANSDLELKDSPDSHHPGHAPKFRMINGKLHLKVYRGIAGEHGEDVMNHAKEGKDFDAAGIQSFSLDPGTAAWFALNRQKEFNEKVVKERHGIYMDEFIRKHYPHLHGKFGAEIQVPPLKGKPYVVEGWMPFDDVTHFGAVNRNYSSRDGTPGDDEHVAFKPQHDIEQEVVFHVKDNKLPHNLFRVHGAHKFVKKHDLMSHLSGIDNKILSRKSDMPVLNTSFDDLIDLAHGSSSGKIPDKLKEQTRIPNPEKDEYERRRKPFLPAPGVVDVKGVPVQTQVPAIESPGPTQPRTRTRHTMKKTSNGSSL